jgi:hypothetical protein
VGSSRQALALEVPNTLAVMFNRLGRKHALPIIAQFTLQVLDDAGCDFRHAVEGRL